MAEDHFPALPAGEEHDHDGGQRQAQSHRHDGARAVSIALVEAEQLDEHQNDIADGMLPGVAQSADAPIAEKVGGPGQRGQYRSDQTGAKQPERAGGEGFIAGLPEHQIKQQGRCKEADGQRNQDRVNRMTHDIRSADRIAGLYLHGDLQTQVLIGENPAAEVRFLYGTASVAQQSTKSGRFQSLTTYIESTSGSGADCEP